MRILVGVCITILALLGCYLPNKQKQADKNFFDENSPQSSDMGSNKIVTKGIFANLKLYEAEHRLLIDIKETLYGLKYGSGDHNVPPVDDYNEENFNKFFLELGFERSKELIKLFGKIKNEQGDDKFKKEVYWLYSCIRELYSLNINYSDGNNNDYINGPYYRPSIDAQYLKVKKGIKQSSLK
ncbi:P52 family lipoprotein [Borreliella bavariensis]|uniref:P52 family lipoprotein n=2 Tax=Borreliella bavariensis TaxID=664662 RepID=UPI00165D774A|nr:P52 family lipoprotein [Borreliella bavariensis]WLN24699.1 P52 family lipoprotein [Borreliella bavariensis]